jgi:hypothetical protein
MSTPTTTSHRFSEATVQAVLEVIGDGPCELTAGEIGSRVGRSRGHIAMVLVDLEAAGRVRIERVTPHPVRCPAGRIVTAVGA